MPSPLKGVRVIDLTSVVFGPLATQILGDLGADVIKIESPEGDSTRYTGPARSKDMAALFMGANRNKRSVVLDLKQESGRKILWRLVDTADVFVHSMRPQKIEKLGFSFPAVHKRNKRVVYAGLHGYRDGGEYSGKPAYDDIIQGQSGIATLMVDVAGEPRYAPTIIADKTCALAAAYAINAALFSRERTGTGEFVEVPMFETMAAFVFTEHLFGHAFVPPEGPLGYSRVLDPWRKPYPTRDGFICMMAYTDPQWAKFWVAVDRPEMARDPRFQTMGDRSRYIGDLYRIAGGSLLSKTTDEWLRLFELDEIPAARIASLDDLFGDPHLRGVDFFRFVDHPSEGPIVVTDQPAKFGGEQAMMNRLQPKLGEHTIEVMRELGMPEESIRDSLRSGAAFDPKTASNVSREMMRS